MGFTNPTPLAVVGPVTLGSTSKVGLAATATLKGITTPVQSTNPTGEALRVGPQLDKVFSATHQGGGSIVTVKFTPELSYAGLIVKAEGTGAAHPLCFYAFETTPPGPAFQASLGASLDATTTKFNATGGVPFSSTPGTEVTLSIVGTAGFYAAVTVWGTTQPLPIELRSDLRAYPLGARSATVQSLGTSEATLVANPGSPLRVMVRSATIGGAWQSGTKLGASVHKILGTVEGNTRTILSAVASGKDAAAANVSEVWEEGILLDKATAVYAQSSALQGTTDSRTGIFTLDFDFIT